MRRRTPPAVGTQQDGALASVHVVALAVLASTAAALGAWAQVAPASFYSDFPGLRSGWVSLDGPYNEHLIRDVGGLNLALALVTAAAALRGRAALARLAALCWLVYGLPHLAYHATHLGPFSPLDGASQLVGLCLQVAVPAWILLSASVRRDVDR